jgi:hypothetical protein
MATYKAVFFYDVNDTTQQQYMTEQMSATKNSLPDLSVELADSNDPRLTLYASKGSRVPCIMVFKGDARMQAKHAKLQHEAAINWIQSRTQ